MKHLIYKITSKTTNLSYIGETSKTLEKRWKWHINHAKRNKPSATKFHKQIYEQGFDNWNLEILEENVLTENRVEKERYWIEKYNTFNNGYNMNKGGGGVVFFSEKIRNQMSKNRKGRIVTKETRNKISQSQKGKLVSEETKKKISEAGKGHVTSDVTKQKLRIANTGRKLSDEAKLKISKVQKGRKKSKEQVEKHRIFMIGQNYRASNYKVTEPNGTEIIVHDLQKYCKSQNINQYNMYAVAAGKRSHHKKYRCTKILNNNESIF